MPPCDHVVWGFFNAENFMHFQLTKFPKNLLHLDFSQPVAQELIYYILSE